MLLLQLPPLFKLKPLEASGFGTEALKALPMFAKIAAKRETRLKHKKGQKKKMDLKFCYKMATFLPDVLDLLNDAIGNTHGALKHVLEVEMTQVQAHITEVYGIGVAAWGTIITDAFDLASDKAIDTEALWAADVVSEVHAIDICNSEAAKALKAQWQTLSEAGEFPSDFKADFENKCLPADLFTQQDSLLGLEATMEKFQSCSNKVGEFVAIRALYRALRPNEQRSKLISSAKATIAELGAVPPSKCGLLLG